MERGDGPIDSAHRGKGSEVMTLTFARSSVFDDLWEVLVAGNQNIRKGFVVAQQHVVARSELIDQIGLEEESLDLGMSGDELHENCLRDHALETVGEFGRMGVVHHPLLEVARLSDIERVAPLVEHSVDARSAG